MPTHLAVIGAGPKGAAIATKAEAMRRAGLPDVPDVTLYDDGGAAAAWTGSGGYTDGEQPLCTLAERDLGFPYDAASVVAGAGRAVVVAMQQAFSWQAYCVAHGRNASNYERWVLEGRRPPAHGEFARYVQQALADSGTAPLAETVRSLDHHSGQWQIGSGPAAGSGVTHTRGFDAVVVTGSGTPRRLPGWPAAGVFDGHDFWLATNRAAVERQLAASRDPQVVIVGAGGTAAAVAHWLLRRQIKCTITIVGREPTLYVRQPAFFEDRLFSDGDAWARLPGHARDAFLRRTAAGIVWEAVLKELVRDNVGYECLEALQFQPAAGGGTALVVSETPDAVQAGIDAALARAGVALPPRAAKPPQTLAATLFVDARGFDRSAFVGRLGLSPGLQAGLPGLDEAALSRLVGPDLDIEFSGFPRGLHLPMLGSRQGPGATNLMALGWMADRVLARY